MNILYLRNSRLTQENSIETQTKMMTDYCNLHDIQVDEIVVDEGISGSIEKINHRLEYQKIIKRIKNNEIDKLIVMSISRWCRNLGETYKSVKLMNETNTKFISLKENIDTSTHFGIFTLNILSSLYEMELEICKERVRDTLQVKKENNKRYCKSVFGFDVVGDDLVENMKEKRLLNKMIKLRKTGYSFGDIQKYLKRNRHKTKSNCNWTRENVYSVLKTHTSIS